MFILRQDELCEEQKHISPSLRAAYVLGMLTEEGLPSYHRLIGSHLEGEVWSAWNNLWTSEEQRHGALLHDYVRYTGFIPDIRALEVLLYQYTAAGFHPDWGDDPYQLLAYTSLQELATQVSHRNLARLVNTNRRAPNLALILAHIAGEEKRHADFYSKVFGLVIERDPDEALASLNAVVKNFAMPGKSMPGYEALAMVDMRLGVFTHDDLGRILLKLLDFWQIEKFAPPTKSGHAIKKSLFRLPGVLAWHAKNLLLKAPRSYSFPFLGQGTSFSL